jgi:predicted acylesterase/phospholipase RssA
MEYDLVFEGGGAKGMVFVGAMEEFFKRGHTHGRLMGASAGAITATLLAAGYTSEEMLTALGETDSAGKPVFASFMGPPGDFSQDLITDGAFSRLLKNIDIPLVPEVVEQKFENAILKYFAEKKPASNLFSLVELGGWYAADNFLKWFKGKMDSGTFQGQPRKFSHMTMDQFHEVTGKDLTLIAADTTGEMMLAINHRTAPDCPVVWAVRMSMSIPLLWQEVIWQEDWGRYRGEDISGHAVVDGGMLSNFPIELFISNARTVTSLMGGKNHDNVMGMLIDEKMPVPGAEQRADIAQGGIKIGELQTVKRLSALMSTMMGARDKAVIAQYEDLVVHLPAKGFGTVEFDMDDERRGLLVDGGRKAMRTFLDGLESREVRRLTLEEAVSLNSMTDRVAERIVRL